MATRCLLLALLCTSQAAANRWQRIVKHAGSLPSQQVLADGSPVPDGATPPQPRPLMGADSPALHTDRQLHIQVATEHLDTSPKVPSANLTPHAHSISDKKQEQSRVAERHRNSQKATVNFTADPAGREPKQQAAALVSMERPASLALNVKGPHSPQVAQLLGRARQDLAHFKNGISQAMVEQVYCTGNYQGFRLQIISNQLYVVGEVINPQWTGTHHRNLKAQLIELAERVDLPDVDLYINTHDWAWGLTPDMSAACPDQGPIISQSTHAAQPHVIPCPDFTFQDWQEAQTPSWELQEYIFHQAAVRHPWDTRVPEMLFRGNLATGNRRVAQDVDWGRLAEDYDITFWNRPDDVGTGKGGYLSLPEHCHWKYLLNWPGNTYSGRLKSIMACGSTVVYPDNGFHEFWYHMLKSGENVVMMDEIRSAEDVYGRLTDVVHELKADDARAQRIGAAGKQLMEEVLTPDSVRLYWHTLISEYSQKMTFNVTKHPDAAPIGISITAPAPISLNEKTCDICGKHWPEGDPRDHWWEGRRRASS